MSHDVFREDMIQSNEWQCVSALLDDALALAPRQRSLWLTEVCTRQPDVAPALRRLLAEAERAEAEPDAPAALVPVFGRWLAHALLADDQALPQNLQGLQLGAWELVEKIGEGGMGQVWEARRADGLYQGQAAIKLLRSDLPAASLSGRFARERSALARLNHPAIGRLLDAGIEHGQAYLVLELVQGQSLNDFVRAHGLTLAQRVALLCRVAEAVDYAHAHLIVHRDLKPSNVMVTDEGQPKLLDFGVAALLDGDDGGPADLTQAAGRGLTLGYAAPEQVLGGPIGTAADVFSLGVMLFELISGGLPFGARGMPRAQLEHAVLHDAPRRLAATPAEPQGPGRAPGAEKAGRDLEAVIGKALRKDPAQRYVSVRAFIDDLGHWAAHRPVSARRGHWRHHVQLWFRRNAWLAAGVLGVTGSLSAGLGASVWQWQRADRAAHESAEVTAYLQELLASASPDRHGGQWPTVLQLLEKSRVDIAERFADSPDTRWRVLEALVATYRQMNRHDLAQPLAQDLVSLGVQRYGEADLRTLQARLDQARSWLLTGDFNNVIDSIEPALPHYRRCGKTCIDEYQDALGLLDNSYAHLGRFDDAERALQHQAKLMASLPEDEPHQVSYLNHLSSVRSGQGRLAEAVALLRRTEPSWQHTEPDWQRDVCFLQRNLLELQVRLGDYDRIEERAAVLQPRIDGLLGPGNGLSVALRQTLARYHQDSGHWRRYLQQQQDTLAFAEQAGVQQAATLLPLRTKVLLARAQTHDIDAAGYLLQARPLLQQTAEARAQLGQQRAEIWLALARGALALDLGELAAEALDTLAADDGLKLPRNPALSRRKAPLDAELARWRGDLQASRALLARQLAELTRGGDQRTLPHWSAALDHAYALSLLADPAAAQALSEARAHRPTQVPPGHPLDAVADYLAARVAAGHVDGPATQPLRAAIAQAVQGRAGAPALPGGRASLYGALY
jgi:hypothetical protein